MRRRPPRSTRSPAASVSKAAPRFRPHPSAKTGEAVQRTGASLVSHSDRSMTGRISAEADPGTAWPQVSPEPGPTSGSEAASKATPSGTNRSQRQSEKPETCRAGGDSRRNSRSARGEAPPQRRGASPPPLVTARVASEGVHPHDAVGRHRGGGEEV